MVLPYGLSCLGLLMSALDLIHSGPAALIRGHVRIGSSSSPFGLTCLGPPPLALDLIQIDSSLLSRTLARLDSSLSVSGLTCLESPPSVMDSGTMGPSPPPRAMA